MRTTLRKLFNLRTGEWPQFSLLYLMYFLYVVGVNWASIVVPALFLVQIGADLLPWIFIGDAIITFLAIAFYMNFADRIADNKLLIGITTGGAITIFGTFVLLVIGIEALAIPLLYLLFRAIRSTFNLHWGVYANNFYDTRTAKRIMPVLSSAVRIGMITAGLSILITNQFLSTSSLIFLWAVTLGIVGIIAYLMPRILSNRQSETPIALTRRTGERQHVSYFENIREGYTYVFQSPYLRWINVAILLFMMILVLLNFEVLKILGNELDTAAEITNFTAGIDLFTSLLVLPIQLFLISRIITRLGLGNANLIFPTATLLVVGLLVGMPTGLLIAGIVYFNINTFRMTFHSNTNSLLYNALPVHIKGRARAFTSGITMPLGTLLAGLISLSLPVITVDWLLPVSLLVLALAYVGSELMVRQQYKRALVDMLEQENFALLLDAPAEFNVADARTMNVLKEKYHASEDDDFKIFMARIINALNPGEFIPILREATTGGSPALRAGMLDILIASDNRSGAARQIYDEFLQDPDPQVRKLAVLGIEQWSGVDNEDYLTLALDLLDDPSPEVQAQVLPALIQSRDIVYMTPAIQVLDSFTQSESPAQQAIGVRILGSLNDASLIRRLAEYLSAPSDLVRLEAATAIETLSRLPARQQYIDRHTFSALRAALEDTAEPVRLAMIRALGYIASDEALHALLPMLDDSSMQVRQLAVESLVHNAKAAAPLLLSTLETTNGHTRRMATAALNLIERRKYDEMIYQHIEHNLRDIYQTQMQIVALDSLHGYRSIEILENSLTEQNRQRLDEIAYLLTAIHPPHEVEAVTASLESDSERARANATEALELMVPPAELPLISALFNPTLSWDDLARVGHERLGLPYLTPKKVMMQFLEKAENPWLQALAVFTLGEVSADLKAQQAKKAARSVRKQSGDLLSALMDDKPEPEARPSASEPVPAAVEDIPFNLDEIQVMLNFLFTSHDAPEEVRLAANATRRMMDGQMLIEEARESKVALSPVEKIIYLKEVPLFQSMTIDQLRVLAGITAERLLQKDETVFKKDDPGGTLYIVAAGELSIAKTERGWEQRQTLDHHQFWGEIELLDNSPCRETATATQDSLLLCIDHEDLMTLMRQYPHLPLEIIRVLSTNLRETVNQIAGMTRAKSRTVHKVYDLLGD